MSSAIDSRGFPSLNGRRFRSVTDVDGGDVGPTTVFDYSEADGVVHASYAGGSIERGFLVGTRTGDELDFRYVQLRSDGTTASGHCVSVITREPDGRLRLEEAWEWESAPGHGTSTVEEIFGGEIVDDLDAEDLSLLDLLR
jgi:hypothetical protein